MPAKVRAEENIDPALSRSGGGYILMTIRIEVKNCHRSTELGSLGRYSIRVFDFKISRLQGRRTDR
jgi:hypothetical protein